MVHKSSRPYNRLLLKMRWTISLALLLNIFIAGCTSKGHEAEAARAATNIAPQDSLPGMPPVLDPNNIYSEDAAGKLSPVVKDFPSRVYVPNSGSNTVAVIHPKTYKIVAH